jgi:hypothetical protein
MPSYLPAGDADRITWLNNFKNKIQQHGASLGFTSAEITSIQNDANMYQYIVQLKEGCKQAFVSLVTLTKSISTTTAPVPMGALPNIPVAGTPPASIITGIFNRVAVYVKRIKSHQNYTPTLGQEFDIIPPSNTINPATMKPVLVSRVDDGMPRITWRKSIAHGVQLYVNRRDNNGWQPLAVRTSNVFIDTTPLPANTITATWDYKAKYVINDNEVGLESDVISVDVNSLGL